MSIVFPEETAAWPFPKQHLSASQLTTFARCPEQYRRVYVLGERQRPAAAMVWGSVDHKAHEVNFRQKITSGVDISTPDLELAYADIFDKQIEDEGGMGEIEWGNEKPGELKDKGIAVAATYHKQVSPRIQPLAVEERFSLDIPDIPVPIIGYTDLRAVVGGPATLFDGEPAEAPGRKTIERKTTSRKASTPKDHWRAQGMLYLRQHGVDVDWHISAGGKTPAVYTPAEEPGLTLAFSEATARAAERWAQTRVRQLISTYNEFGPDDPWPDTTSYGWACGFCGFRPTCPYWAHERKVAA